MDVVPWEVDTGESPGGPFMVKNGIQAPWKMNSERVDAEKSAAQARIPSRPASHQRPQGL